MRKRNWVIAVLGIAAMAVSGGDALAKKGGGGKPGGGGDPPNTTPPDIACSIRDTRELGVLQDDGTGLVAIAGTTGLYGKAGWSPDGTELAFWSHEPEGDGVYVIGADGTGLRKVISANAPVIGSTVAWSPVPAPDGKYKLAYLDEPDEGGTTDVFLVNLDGTGRENVTHTSGHREESVSWSPDAKRLAVDTVYTVRVVDLVRRDVSGVPRQFEVFSTVGVTPVNASSLEPANAEWAKTSDQIVFVMRDDTMEQPRPDLFVFAVSWSDTASAWLGTTPVNITNSPNDEESHPSWSPDDSEIVFRNRYWKPKGKGIATPSLAIIDTTSRARRTLFDGNADVRDPSWRRAAP